MMQFGYSFYLNHFNDATKDIIQGTNSGMQQEWDLHNVAYIFFSLTGNKVYADRARSVDV